MGLQGSELGIDNSDSSILSSPSNLSSLNKSDYEYENGEGIEGANLKSEYSGFGEGDKDVDEEEEGMDEDEEDEDEDEEDEDEDDFKDLKFDYDPDEDLDKYKNVAGVLSRAELRKMQEELEYQEGDIEHPNQMDLRLGRIINVVPDDGDPFVYISEIYLGEYDETRLVSTNLRQFYPERKELMNRYVVILCNVNPMDDRGIKSKTGMLLLATKTKFNNKGREIGELAELIGPTFCDKEGARIYVDGYPVDKPEPPRDEEFFDFVIKDFLVDIDGQVAWRGLPLKIEGCPLSNLAPQTITDTYCKLD